MKRLVLCILLSSFGGDARSAVLRTADEVRPHYVPQLVVSDIIWPFGRSFYRGYWWQNYRLVPCYLQSYAVETKFTVVCHNMPDAYGDLRDIPRAVGTVNID